MDQPYGKAHRDELVKTFIEIEPLSDDAFLKIRETLTRIGIANKRSKTLFQTAHVLHKQGRYYIVHFKELFALDGKAQPLEEEDNARKYAIAALLEQWNMCKIVNNRKVFDTVPNFMVLRHQEKQEWNLVKKYFVGGEKVRYV